MALKAVKGIPISVSLPSVIWERIMDVLVLILFGISGLSFIAAEKFLPLIMISVGLFSALIAFLVLIMYCEGIGRKAFGFLRKFPVLNRINDDFLSNFYSGCRFSRAGLFLCFVWTFIAWLFDGIAFYLVYLALSPGGFNITSPITFTCILALSVLIGLISSLPGGAGGTEAIMILILAAVGIPHEIGGSTVLIGRALTFGWSIVAGYAAFVYLGKRVDLDEITKSMGI
jgi:uncharacterized protein (TIRG00374 family)